MRCFSTWMVQQNSATEGKHKAASKSAWVNQQLITNTENSHLHILCSSNNHQSTYPKQPAISLPAANELQPKHPTTATTSIISQRVAWCRSPSQSRPQQGNPAGKNRRIGVGLYSLYLFGFGFRSDTKVNLFGVYVFMFGLGAGC